MYVCCADSAAVQQCLMTSSVWEAIRAVDSMAVLDTGLSQSGCSHLQDFLRETLHFWHKIIKDRLAGCVLLSNPTLHLIVSPCVFFRNTFQFTVYPSPFVHCLSFILFDLLLS